MVKFIRDQKSYSNHTAIHTTNHTAMTPPETDCCTTIIQLANSDQSRWSFDHYGRPPLHGQIIQQVIQQVIQQIIQLFWSFWVGITDCCMTFRDQNPISTTSEHVQMLQRLRTCCMSLIDKSVKLEARYSKSYSNHTAFNVIALLLRHLLRHFIISQTA